MKALKALLFLFLFGIMLSSCEKGMTTEPANVDPSEDSLGPAIVGTYRLDTAKMKSVWGQTYMDGHERSLYIDNDSVVRVERLDLDFRYAQKFKLNGKSFTEGNSKLILSRKGNELTQQREGSAFITFYTATTLPERKSLVTFVPIIDEIDYPQGAAASQRTGLAAINQKLYMVLYGTGKISLFSIDQNSKEVVQTPITFKDSGYATGGICAVAGNLWVAVDHRLEQINPVTGVSNFSSVDIAGEDDFLSAITYDGSTIIAAVNYYNANYSELYQYNLSTNTVTKIQKLSDLVTGLDYKNGKLLISHTSSIEQCTLTPFKVERTFAIDHPQLKMLSGITHIDNSVWGFVRYEDGLIKLAKMSL